MDLNDARFHSEILSISTANPGWQVHVQHLYTDPGQRGAEVGEESWHAIAAWALVKRIRADGSEQTETEPVFVDANSLINATEYRRLHSDLDPDPGQPKIRVRIAIKPPTGPEEEVS
ncbi:MULTISPECIES: hypothetical protein [Streptomyces]|uniref:Uncharacterized protein n=2 Tax=Streptomyces TaxID=1883 RepID=A0A2U9NYX1_STRAS|nr:hypothetical protein [Streptomyces actuosus]AWT42539.1 hypothetical protein DMT42_09575 [Streptomyces actuosus]MBM4819741.1 hypothetical protein [Streptomyces actuosus]